MGFLSKIFTWWDGATIGTSLFTARHGEHVGTDAQGNKYYRSKPKDGQAERRDHDARRRVPRLPAAGQGQDGIHRNEGGERKERSGDDPQREVFAPFRDLGSELPGKGDGGRDLDQRVQSEADQRG